MRSPTINFIGWVLTIMFWVWLLYFHKKETPPKTTEKADDQKLCVHIYDEGRGTENTITIVGNPDDGYLVRDYDMYKDRRLTIGHYTFPKVS